MGKPQNDGGFKLSPEVHRGIVAMVGAGAFPHVAAQANGIAPRTFAQYMREDFREHFHEQHHEAIEAFQADVRAAGARARGAAEIEVRKKKPFEWLRYGPGRDRGKDNPGWTDSSKVEVTGANGGPILTAVAALDLSNLTGDELDGLERMCEKVAGSRGGSAAGGAG